ncbi:MAG: NAD(P)H-hydrate dehydratase [Bacteroidia bacterium]
MKIFSGEQIRVLDQDTIKNEPVSSIDLMERAAMACVSWILERFPKETGFAVVCGPGNNGGDGLAIARLLKKEGCQAHAYFIHCSERISEEAKENYERLHHTNRNDVKELSGLQEAFGKEKVIIDSLFGSGLNKPLSGLASEAVRCMNTSGNRIVSIDVPSGLYCDRLNENDDVIVKADHTLTFQAPKYSFMFPENASYTGEFSILDIQLDKSGIDAIAVNNFFLLKEDVRKLIRPRMRNAHKGNFGHALLLCGSKGMIGAAVLSSRSCMRTGVGLLTAHVPGCGYSVMQTSVPEAMTSSDADQEIISSLPDLDGFSAVGIGPGIGRSDKTAGVLKQMLLTSKLPLVLDADALNIISANRWLDIVPAGSILTPHPKEFERFAGQAGNSQERLSSQRALSIAHKIFIVLKGAHTSISFPDGAMYFNSTGNPGMATAGSGDVLTGMITSLLAQGYSAGDACRLGVYVHGLAGDIASSEKGEIGMIASDLIEYIPAAFNYLQS